MPPSPSSSRTRSSSPPSPTTPDPRRPLLPRAISQHPPRRVPLRYAWRGKMTWPLRGDPRRYSTFPPYNDGNPIIVFGRNAVSWLVVAFRWLAAVLKMTLWNFPAGLIIGLSLGVALCKSARIKLLNPSTTFSLQPTTPAMFSYDYKDSSIFVQAGGSMVDREWESLGANMRNIVAQESELAPGLELNSSHVQVAQNYGGGYIVEMKGFRSLHCLNALRQSLYFNAEHYHEAAIRSGTSKERVREELDSCLEALRQQLMCLVDTNVHGFLWARDGSNQMTPDLDGSRHVCYDFHKLRDWAKSRQVPGSLPKDYYVATTPISIKKDCGEGLSCLA